MLQSDKSSSGSIVLEHLLLIVGIEDPLPRKDFAISSVVSVERPSLRCRWVSAGLVLL